MIESKLTLIHPSGLKNEYEVMVWECIRFAAFAVFLRSSAEALPAYEPLLGHVVSP